MYAEHAAVRTDAALDKAVLLPITSPAGTQPCDTFGVHPSMPQIHSLYIEGSALFATNVGALVEPATKEQAIRRTVQLPPSLFAHNIMQRNVQNVEHRLGRELGDVAEGRANVVQATNRHSASSGRDVSAEQRCVVLSVSDFARTLTSNGKGTDHSWGGNHFVACGSQRRSNSRLVPGSLVRRRRVHSFSLAARSSRLCLLRPCGREFRSGLAYLMTNWIKFFPTWNFPETAVYSKEKMFKKF